LDAASITVNKNTIPFDTNPPMVASGVRIGTPALTTRGMGESEMREVATLIADVVNAPDDEGVRKEVRDRVLDITSRFPLYPKRGLRREVTKSV
jgi:glycine hydroxymethyltransferase